MDPTLLFISFALVVSLDCTPPPPTLVFLSISTAQLHHHDAGSGLHHTHIERGPRHGVHHSDTVFRGAPPGLRRRFRRIREGETRQQRPQRIPGVGLPPAAVPTPTPPRGVVRDLLHGEARALPPEGNRDAVGLRRRRHNQDGRRRRARHDVGPEVVLHHLHRRRDRGLSQGVRRARLPGLLRPRRTQQHLPPVLHGRGGQSDAPPAGDQGAA